VKLLAFFCCKFIKIVRVLETDAPRIRENNDRVARFMEQDERHYLSLFFKLEVGSG
jgi:hypothetical protein